MVENNIGNVSELSKDRTVRTKSAARLVAVQSIYSIDLNNTPDAWQDELVKVLAIYDSHDQTSGDLGQINPDRKLLVRILENVANNIEQLDPIIEDHLNSSWTISKLGPVLRSILRAGLAELMYLGDVPTKVVINEYTTLTKQFYTESEIGFVNAILQKMSQYARPSSEIMK